MNKNIKMLHEQLIKANLNLSERLGKTKTKGDAEAILNEMQEINHRVMLAGRFLFKKSSAEIDKNTQPVLDACADLDQAMKKIEKISDLIQAVGKALTKVDEALDKLKLIL